ncbi:hypothetical protein CQ018_05125 [Arthrobacter sp. MYb227]|uniref:DUF7927 domain-containing protein n=1 Tax=Arthrobacter sp. MYb227 TaxID=1848601 RepID=UPI000CFD147C|nr:hypothetical protein [Arthrobacter sp. MYb227]PQZ94730.1 hypothetical protein CQ018_05125 [Arthrobacter sp. MYb227]
MNGESNAFPVSQNSPEWLVKDLAIPPGRIPPAFTGGTTQRNPNALGVTEDGVFYFTNQYQQALLTANGKRHEFIDVWRYESDQPIAESTNPRRIISGMDLGETLNTENPQQIVAGAFNPFDEAFYFGMYQPEGIAADRKIQLKVFKAAISGNDWSAGLIGTALTPKGSFLSATNGDFDFDSAGNLTFLVSSQGTVADAYLGTINSEDIQAASTTTPATFEDFTISQKLTFSTGTSGGQANGMVFARSGQLVVQASDYQRMLNPNTFSETASINPFPPTGPSDRILTTDLASFASPPTVRVDKDVIARIDPTDQFALRLGDGAKYQSIHTNGVGGELDASGLQDRKLGPVGVYTGDTVTIGETMAPDSPTLDTTLYSPIFRCVNTELPITDPNYEVDLSDLGTGFERSLEVPATLPGSWKGPQVVCTITNEGQIPALTVSKTSDPETGVAVTEEQDVKYTLSFDNTAGTGAALEVDYTDHLKDVLDDAELDLSSLAVLDVTDPDTPLEVTDGFFAVYDADAQTIKIAGAKDGTGTATVPAKTKYTLSYTVSVKPNIGTEGKPREDSDNATAYKMTNFLVEGNDEVPEKCTAPGQDEDPVCTDHLVKTWTISKDSKPSNGAQLHHGGNIYYNLEVQKTDPSYQIDGIVVTDDLSEVLRVAEWDASAPVLDGTQARGIHMMDERGNVVRSLEASYVPAPVYNGTDRWTLTTVAFSLLPGEVSAQIWFAVKVGTPPQVAPHWLPESPSPGTHFTNRVSAAAGAQEPEANQCRTGITEGEIGGAVAACTVSHAVGADYFTVRKDGRGTLATGETLNLQNLLGHEFELRSDNDGSMGAVPGFMCESSSTPPALDSTESCARFYPIPTGQQAGRWRAERVPAGTYWLLETKAPTAQRVSATETRKVTGVQLLAEPIKFIVGEEAKFGQLDIFTPGTVLFEERCDPVNSPTFIACVNPSGYLMIVRDPGLLPLPVSGGNGVSALTFGALVLIGGGLGAGYLWRRNRYGQPTP